MTIPVLFLALTATSLLKVPRVASPQLSADGAQVIFQVTNVDVASGVKRQSLHVVPAAGGPGAGRSRPAANTDG